MATVLAHFVKMSTNKWRYTNECGSL